MYRLIISFLLRGAMAGAGLAMFIWLGRYRFSWQIPLGFLAAIMLITFLRLIPVLRMESLYQQMLRDAGDDRAKVEALLGQKRTPLISFVDLVFFGLLGLCGLIARISR